jgi:hypothetical protein
MPPEYHLDKHCQTTNLPPYVHLKARPASAATVRGICGGTRKGVAYTWQPMLAAGLRVEVGPVLEVPVYGIQIR